MPPISDEQAKAIQEVAKTTNTLIEGVQSFYSKVLGGALAEIGGIVADEVKLFRYRNLLRIRDKIDAIHAKRNLDGNTVPIAPKHAIPMIEKASLEDDESLQDMWASLMANAMDPAKQLDSKRIFVDILGSLEPLDVRILKHMSSLGWNMFQFTPGGGATLATIRTATGAEEKAVSISLQNLHRLGLVIDEFSPPEPKSKNVFPPVTDSKSFGFTLLKVGTTFRPAALGFDLLKACEA